MRGKCLAGEHNPMSPARAGTRTACSGVKCTNHEATVPPKEYSSVNYGEREAWFAICKEEVEEFIWSEILG